MWNIHFKVSGIEKIIIQKKVMHFKWDAESNYYCTHKIDYIMLDWCLGALILADLLYLTGEPASLYDSLSNHISFPVI